MIIGVRAMLTKKNKNYFAVIFVSIITIVGCIYALKWHAVYKEKALNTAVINGYIQEIKSDEFDNYINENLYSIIYFGIPSNPACRAFEEKLKDFISEHNLRETIVYLNVDNITKDDFSDILDKTYNSEMLRGQNKYLNEIPAIAIYKHNQLIDFVSGTNLTTKKVKELLKNNNLNGV